MQLMYLEYLLSSSNNTQHFNGRSVGDVVARNTQAIKQNEIDGVRYCPVIINVQINEFKKELGFRILLSSPAVKFLDLTGKQTHCCGN